MKFSIVVPTYNEQDDIAGTLDALISLTYSNREIVVVDDSTDNTPNIIRKYERHGVILITPNLREGRCGARNIGILASKGEVVVILNADVRLPPDFLDRILIHYQNGFDYVLVKSQVSNIHSLFARYVASVASSEESGDPSWMEWTEGFSCKRDIAIKAGLFPVGYAVPICAGEDGYFGAELKKIGAKKVVDFSIVVPHIAPSKFLEYWEIRKGRGRGSPQIRRFLQKWTYRKIIIRACLRILRNIVFVATLFPILFKLIKYSKYSNRGILDIPLFGYSWLIEQLAFHVGEWSSILEIIKKEKIKNKCHL